MKLFMIKNHSRVHGLCGAIHYSTRGTDLGQGKGLMEQGRLSQNRKHFLQYDNLVRTTDMVPRHFTKSWNQSVEVQGATIHPSFSSGCRCQGE